MNQKTQGAALSDADIEALMDKTTSALELCRLVIAADRRLTAEQGGAEHWKAGFDFAMDGLVIDDRIAHFRDESLKDIDPDLLALAREVVERKNARVAAERSDIARKWDAAALTTQPQAEPGRAQQMRDAGFTRRPTLREMAEPADARVPGKWERIETLLTEYVHDYEMEYDNGCGYSPTEDERAMILDALMGLTADNEFLALLATPTAQPQAAQQADSKDAARWRFTRDNRLQFFEPTKHWRVTDAAGKTLCEGRAETYEIAVDTAIAAAMGWPTVPPSPGGLREQLAALTADDRLELLREYCRGCGGPSPCNCTRDD